MKIIAIVQARMGSKRLPGKVMMPIAGKPIIGHIVTRLMKSDVDEVIVACPRVDIGTPLAVYLYEQKIPCYFGDDENDLCARFLSVLNQYACDAFVRICGDSPLIDPTVVNEAVANLRNGDKFFSNVGLKTIPRGQSVEGAAVHNYRALCRMCAEEDLEHAGFPYIYREIAMHDALVDTMDDYLRVKGMVEDAQ